MKRFQFVLAIFITLTCGAVSTHASSITYTETVTATGKLDGTAFTSALVTLTLTGNTSTVTNPSSGLFHDTGSATVSVAGDGSDTFTDSIAAFSNETGGVAGFIDLSTDDILDTINAGFGSYALSTAIGPLSGFALFNPSTLFNTSSGSFDMSAVSGNATFTATTTVAPSAAPEPSSLLMLAAGLVGLVGFRRGRVPSRFSKAKKFALAGNAQLTHLP